MDKYKISLLLQCLVFLIPINIYVIGDWLGTGVQWALFRYQQTYLGDSLILVTRGITFVLNGTIGGMGGISLVLWAIGALLFIIAMILVILATIKKDSRLIKKASVFTITGGIVFTALNHFSVWFFTHQPVGICHSRRHPDHFCYRVVDVSGTGWTRRNRTRDHRG